MLTAVSLGANLGSPIAALNAATRQLACLPASKLIACSSAYRSRPLGPKRQPDYINSVILIETCLAPIALLNYLQGIERKFERRRGVRQGLRWGPRNIDLDIIAYGDKSIRSKNLTIPHQSADKRIFVLKPLAEIAPQLSLPGKGKVCELLAALGDDKTCWKINNAG